MLTVVDRCESLLASGVPFSAIEELDFSPVLRAREDNGPDDVEGCRRDRDEMLDRLERLA